MSDPVFKTVDGVQIELEGDELAEFEAQEKAWEDGGAAEFLWENIRLRRNLLLSACDYKMLTDVECDAHAWIEYRQALRDIPLQADVNNIVWPVVPA